MLIHVKKGEDLNLYVEHDAETDVDTVSRETIDVYNLVLRAKRLKSACDDLVQYGPMKPPEKQVSNNGATWAFNPVCSDVPRG